MSKDKDKEAPETSNSKEPAMLPSKASSEEDAELTTTKRAEEREVVVVKPSKTEYKESNRTDKSSSDGEEEDKQEEQEGEGEQSVSAAAKAKESGRSFKEMIKSLGKKVMTKTEEKTKELDKSAAETVGTGPQKDARDIQALGAYAENVVLVFEKTMAEIQREDYESQEKLLAGYKKLLEEQINVIDSKQRIAKRLKGISK
jgi:hypothetical protein